MALDPSIILQAGRGVTPMESPLDIQAKVTQLRGMQQAQEMLPAQMDLQRQRLQADADEFRMKMQQYVDKLNQEQREETRRRALDMGKAADWVKAGGLEAPMRWDKAAVSLGLPEYVGKYDPSQLDLLKIQAMTMTDLLKEKEEGNITGGVHADPGGNAWGTTKKGQAVPIMDPATGRQMKVRSPGSGGSGGHGGTNSSVMPQGSSDDIALAFIQGRRKTPTGRELADRETKAGWLKALQMDPTLNDSTIKLRQNAQKEADTGKLGSSNNAIKTVLGHMGHLVDAYQELPDYGAGKGLNWLVGKVREAGPGGNPALQKVYDLVEAIGPEMSKAYVPGQGTESERGAWKERINPFRPEAERKASANVFGEMLITKLNANEAQFRKAFKGLSDNVVPPPMQLDEDAYNAIKKIEAYTGEPIKGADKWVKRYEESNGESPATPQPVAQPAGATKSVHLPYSGKTATQEDLEATAKARGLSVVEVKRKWIQGGGRVQ